MAVQPATSRPTEASTMRAVNVYPPLAAGALVLSLAALSASSDPLPPDATYRPLPTLPLSEVMQLDEAMKPDVMQTQRDVLARRYDLADRPIEGAMMSGGRKAIQGGVRVKLPNGVTWEQLAGM